MSNELQNSINYIKEKTGNSLSFSVPEDYFKGIEDNFILKLKEDKLPKKSAFDIPDTYFENLETKILETVKKNPKKGKVIYLRTKLNKLIPVSIAASLLIFISTQFFKSDNNSLNFDEIAYTDVENWFNENTIYTETELVFTLEDEINYNEVSLASTNINDDAIEDYLNSIDESDLTNEF